MKFNKERVVEIHTDTSSSQSSGGGQNDSGGSKSSSETVPDLHDLAHDEGMHLQFEKDKSKFLQQFEYSAIRNLNVE